MKTATKKASQNGTKPQLTLADLSPETLKAMCYDEILIIQAHQANLQALNQELSKRLAGTKSASPPL